MTLREMWETAVFLSGKRGFGVGTIIGIVVLAVVLVTAGIPVVTDSLRGPVGPNGSDAAIFNGTVRTITDQYPIFLALVGLVVITSMLG